MSAKRIATFDIVLVIAVSLGAYIIELAFADFLPWGSEARGVLAVMAAAALVLGITFYRGRSLADIGFKKPERWITFPLWVIGTFIVFVIAQNLIPFVLSMFIDLPAPDMSRYDFIKGNIEAAIFMAFVLPVTAAIPEEIVYRGFLIERLACLFQGASGIWKAVFVQSLIFGLIHFQWGIGGILMTIVMGIIWGSVYVLCGRNLWVVVTAHSLAHIALVMQIYHS